MKYVIVFDLDDTLYSEKTFVESGFKAVANYLNTEYALNKDNSLQFMLRELKKGRGKIFNKLLLDNNLNSTPLVSKCLSVYRLHKPEINLDRDALDCIKRLEAYPKYIITDGNKIVQNNKIKALGLDAYFKRSFITHRFGTDKAKPSPYCMQQIIKLEDVGPSHAVYIADNPIKDFVGLKPLGFKTIRVLKGIYKNELADEVHNAELSVNSLVEVNENLLNEIFKR